MGEHGKEPNHAVEELLHHSPITDMLDGYLLSEIRLAHGAQSTERAAALGVARRMSRHLHALLSHRVDEV